jgi:hypothetical protein
VKVKDFVSESISTQNPSGSSSSSPTAQASLTESLSNPNYEIFYEGLGQLTPIDKVEWNHQEKKVILRSGAGSST